MKKILVNAEALRAVLEARTGPAHHIRELQAIRSPVFGDNPINKLIDDFNAEVEAKRVGLFQERVAPWLMECFGPEISGDREERNQRFFEESTELVQSCGMSRADAHALVDYVYDRPVGEPKQEVGGVMVTLAALCLANNMNLHEAGETELTRISTPEMIEKIRAKQAAKPKGSPLPQTTAQPAAYIENHNVGTVEEVLKDSIRFRALISAVFAEVSGATLNAEQMALKEAFETYGSTTQEPTVEEVIRVIDSVVFNG